MNRVCNRCNGKGKIEAPDQSEWVNATQYCRCPDCGGSGKPGPTQLLQEENADLKRRLKYRPLFESMFSPNKQINSDQK